MQELLTARAVVAAGLAPMGIEEIGELLTRLRLATTPRRQSDVEILSQNVIYADELSQYPADVVRFVMRTQPAKLTWFPSWAELYPRLEQYARPRRLLHAALDREITRLEAA